MLTVTCRLTFRDGQEVTGRIEARSAGENYPITYGGKSARLGMRLPTGTASDLELLFSMAAKREDAKLVVERSGKYESKTDAIARERPRREQHPPAT
jgi:hypothetical protein